MNVSLVCFIITYILRVLSPFYHEHLTLRLWSKICYQHPCCNCSEMYITHVILLSRLIYILQHTSASLWTIAMDICISPQNNTVNVKEYTSGRCEGFWHVSKSINNRPGSLPELWTYNTVLKCLRPESFRKWTCSNFKELVALNGRKWQHNIFYTEMATQYFLYWDFR